MDKHKEKSSQIQLELPDYSRMYYEYMQKKEQENKEDDTVIILDI